MSRSAAPAPAGSSGEVSRSMTTLARMTSRRRFRLGAVAVAVVAVVLVVSATRGSFSNDAVPEPMDRQVPQGPFDWVRVRGTTVEVRDVTGTLRWSGDLRRWGLGTHDVRYAYLSNAGWLSAPTGRGMWLVDLTDATSEPRFIKGVWDSRAWSPNGQTLAALYGAPNSSRLHPSFVNPESGIITELPGWFTGGGPNPAWAADSSGVLVPRHGRLVMEQVDGTAVRGTIPDLWLRSDRTIGADGRWLGWSRRVATARDAAGVKEVWYDHDLAEPIVWGQLTADAQAAVLLLQSASDRSKATLVRVDAAGDPLVIDHLRVDGKVSYFELSPDDSVAHISVGKGSMVLPLTGKTHGVVAAPGFSGWVTHALVGQLVSSTG